MQANHAIRHGLPVPNDHPTSMADHTRAADRAVGSPGAANKRARDRPGCPATGDSYSERIGVYAHASSIEMLVELVCFVDSHDLQDLDQLLLFADLIKYGE